MYLKRDLKQHTRGTSFTVQFKLMKNINNINTHFEKMLIYTSLVFKTKQYEISKHTFKIQKLGF